MNRKSLLDRPLFVKWARAPKRGEVAVKKRGEETVSNKPTGIKKPLAPPGGVSKAPIPKAAVKPPTHVAAMIAARRQRMGGGGAGASGVPRPGSALPRPGGGPVRGVGKRPAGDAGKPYYPSSDPSRLGSKSAPDS